MRMKCGAGYTMTLDGRNVKLLTLFPNSFKSFRWDKGKGDMDLGQQGLVWFQGEVEIVYVVLRIS